MRSSLLPAAALLALWAALPVAAQRRPVPERDPTTPRPTVTSRGDLERRAAGAARVDRPLTTCAVFVTAPLKVGRVEWWPGADDRRLWVDVPAATGLFNVGPDNRGPRRGSLPRVGIVSIEAPGTERITLSVTAPTLLQGDRASIPFTGEWAVSDRRKTGYIAMAGSAREVALPPSGRIYIRLGGRVAFTPEELPEAKRGQEVEYAAEWLVHVSAQPAVATRTRVPGCLHMVAVPVSATLRHPASVCSVTASPDALSFGTLRRTGTPELTNYDHTHAVTVDETKTPADVSLTDTDHLEWVQNNAARGWMAVTAGLQGALVLAQFPGTVDHTAPPDPAPADGLTALPFSSSWAYHVGEASPGDEFTQIGSSDVEWQQSHQVPASTTHEYAFGGTLTIDTSPNTPVKPKALPGSHEAVIVVTVSCN